MHREYCHRLFRNHGESVGSHDSERNGKNKEPPHLFPLYLSESHYGSGKITHQLGYCGYGYGDFHSIEIGNDRKQYHPASEPDRTGKETGDKANQYKYNVHRYLSNREHNSETA
jgi:hypothetical protein